MLKMGKIRIFISYMNAESIAGGAVACLVLFFGSAFLAGCGGPTYGTGQSSGQQLVSDFANITKWGSLSSNKNVDTRPRPELIHPTSADLSRPLPPPQQALARKDNPDWPESPEERLARLRAEAADNRDNPRYVSPIIQDTAPQTARYLPTGVDRMREREDNMPNALVIKRQAARYKGARQAEKSNSAAPARKYLSDPPVEFLTPSANAPKGELGLPEDEKERKSKSGRTSLFGK